MRNLQARSCTWHGPSHNRRKERVFLWKGIQKNIIPYYFSAFSINPQPRCISLRSHRSVFLIHVSSLLVLLIHVLSLHVLLIHVLSIQSMFYQSSSVHVLSHAIQSARKADVERFVNNKRPPIGNNLFITALRDSKQILQI